MDTSFGKDNVMFEWLKNLFGKEPLIKKEVGGFEILDGVAINFEVVFSILCRSDFNKVEVLGNCILALKDFFDITKWQMGQPIIKAQVLRLLYDVAGVFTVPSLAINNLAGTVNGLSYSIVVFNIEGNTKNDLIYCPANSIMECKFPDRNLIGSAR